jgi:hypothetical protein
VHQHAWHGWRDEDGRWATRSSERYDPGYGTWRDGQRWVDTSWQAIRSNWPQARADLLHRFGRLTEADVDSTHGQRITLLARIQDRYGLSNERADAMLADWQRSRAS